MMLPREIMLPRLVFVRYLYNTGLQHIAGRFPAASVLCFHDAIEIFLQIGIEHHQSHHESKADFLKMFDELKASVPDLERKHGIIKLNEARVILKHKAIELSKSEADSCLNRCQTFLEENCPKVFGIDFFSIWMSESIYDERVRNELQVAERALGEGNLFDSLAAAAKAFAKLRHGHEIFSGGRVSNKGDQTAAEVVVALDVLSVKVAFISIGIPYARYQKFKQLAPSVTTKASGKHTVAFSRANVTADQARLCIDFVVDVALAMEQYERQLAS